MRRHGAIRGAALLDYALAASLISIVSIAAIRTVGQRTNVKMNNVSVSVADAGSAALFNGTVSFIPPGRNYNRTTLALNTTIYTNGGGIPIPRIRNPIPAEFLGAVMFRTDNRDRTNTSTNRWRVNLTRAAKVYVSLDKTMTTLPAWMNDGTWTRTGIQVTTNRPAQSPMVVYEKWFPAGQTWLGGGGGAATNYFVVIKPVP